MNTISGRCLIGVSTAAFWLLAASTGFGQAAGQWTDPAHIWRASCGHCHGAGVAPELRGRRLAADNIRAIVRRGVAGMPVFHPSELNDAELAALARWIARSPE